MGKREKLVFVSSPFRATKAVTAAGKEKEMADNLAYARELCKDAIDYGYVPVAPHLIYPQFLKVDKAGDAAAMECSRRLIEACDEVWICPRGEDEISEGMREEMNYAARLKKTIVYHYHKGKSAPTKPASKARTEKRVPRRMARCEQCGAPISDLDYQLYGCVCSNCAIENLH